MNTDPGNFAAIGFTLFAAHQLGDNWFQTTYMATKKTGRHEHAVEGRWACASHVLVMTLVKVVALLLLTAVTGLDTNPLAVVIGLALDAGSHYWADRRFTLEAFAEKVGRGEFYHLGLPREGKDDLFTLGGGWLALDQSWHIGWLFVTALILSL